MEQTIKKYSFLSEAHFWRKLGKSLKDDILYTKQRWFGGKGREYVRAGRQGLDPSLTSDRNALEYAAKGLVNTDGGLKGWSRIKRRKYDNDVIDYLDKFENWKKSKSELGDEIKGWFRKNTKPIQSTASNVPSDLPFYVGTGGIGILGAKTAIDLSTET